jgi:hypothetical protein
MGFIERYFMQTVILVMAVVLSVLGAIHKEPWVTATGGFTAGLMVAVMIREWRRQ